MCPEKNQLSVLIRGRENMSILIYLMYIIIYLSSKYKQNMSLSSNKINKEIRKENWQ